MLELKIYQLCTLVQVHITMDCTVVLMLGLNGVAKSYVSYIVPYGPYQLEEGDYSTVLGIFEKQYREDIPLTITADGKQRRDFTHVEDIVDGLVRCSQHDFKAQFFELGSGVNYSINEVADMFGKDYPREYIPARKGEYDRTLCDYSVAELKLGWLPKHDLRDYIKNAIK